MLWALTFSVESSLVKLRAACRNRTDDLFITSDRRWVLCRRLMSAAVPLTCEYSDLLSAGVGRNRMPLAPRLAPQVSDL
jgi:hypothetical protein